MLAFTTVPTIEANPNTAVPLAAIVRFKTNRPVQTTLSVTDGAHHWAHEFDSSKKTQAGLPVVGMRPNREHQVRITVEDDEGGRLNFDQTLTITTPPLPDDVAVFPPLNVTVSKPERMEPGMTLIMARRRIPGEPTELSPEQRHFMMRYGLIIAVDDAGEVVWYYETHSRIADAIRLRNGNFLCLTADYRATEIDLLGNEVAAWYAAERPEGGDETAVAIQAQTIHHCIYELSNGNFMAFTAQAKEVADYYSSEWDPNAPRQTQMVMGDTIIEFTREGKIVWRWNCFDHLDPYRIGYETLYTYWHVRGFPGHADWTHGNSLWIDEVENTIIVSLRYMEACIKIDRQSGEIIWILGEHTDWGDLADQLLHPIGDVQWPYHMHTPSMTGDGTFLLFDNGVFGSRPFTPPKAPKETNGRAVEYKIDEAEMTVRQLWESDKKGAPDNAVSYAMGDADWLPQTGNVLVSYGMCPRQEDVHKIKNTNWNECSHYRAWTRIREVTRTNPAEILFEVVLQNEAAEPDVGWVCFGAERIAEL